MPFIPFEGNNHAPSAPDISTSIQLSLPLGTLSELFPEVRRHRLEDPASQRLHLFILLYCRLSFDMKLGRGHHYLSSGRLKIFSFTYQVLHLLLRQLGGNSSSLCSMSYFGFKLKRAMLATFLAAAHKIGGKAPGDPNMKPGCEVTGREETTGTGVGQTLVQTLAPPNTARVIWG